VAEFGSIVCADSVDEERSVHLDPGSGRVRDELISGRVRRLLLLLLKRCPAGH
jgi:hypothetical protein